MRFSRQAILVIFTLSVVAMLTSFLRMFSFMKKNYRPSLVASYSSGFKHAKSFDDIFNTPIQPFEKGKPKILVILAYQRSGSTFLGRLFNTNPDSFFIYEPLDSLYSSLYGTRQGWNVPTDITTYSDGRERVLPDFELRMVSKFLQSLLFCEMEALPTEALVHRYMFTISNESLAISDYSRCLRQKKLKPLLANYRDWMPWDYCGERFGEKSRELLNECRMMLSSEEYRKEHRNHENISLFENYLAHAGTLRSAVTSSCLKLFSDACNRVELRVTKVVRASMMSMKTLLEDNPNFRLIHLIRDPRAVVLSRKNFLSSGGLFTKVDRNGSMILEAELYCRTVVRDIKIRTELEKSHRGKIFTIIYDDMVNNFRKYSERVYQFMDAPIPEQTQFMIDEVEENKNSSLIANRWKNVLTFKEHADIWRRCHEFYRMTKYDWPH